MEYNPGIYRVFGLCPWSGVLKNRRFLKLDLCPSSDKGVGTPTLLAPLERTNLSPLERANLNH
jgi:hypothetical protein